MEPEEWPRKERWRRRRGGATKPLTWSPGVATTRQLHMGSKFSIWEQKGLEDQWQHEQGHCGTSELFVVLRNPSQSCSWLERKPASHPCCSRSSPDGEYNAALDYTAKGKIPLVPCHRVQSFPISDHGAKSCLVCVVRSEPKWSFLAYALKTKLKTAHLYRPLITYLIITSTVPYSDKGIFNWYQ